MNKTESDRRGTEDGEFNDETSSQLLNQQLWITGGEAALQEVFTSFFPIIL